MKTLLVALLLASTAAHADLVIVQKVDAGAQSGEQTIRIKGDRARTDLTPEISMLSNAATGDSITLMHASRTFLKVSAADAKKMLEKLQKRRPADAPPPVLTATGKKEKIGRLECELFTTNFGGMAVSYWIAKSYPNFPAVLAQMEKLQAGSVSAMGRGLMPALKDFPGLPIRTELELGGQKITTVLLSVREEDVNPASFEIPPGYTEVTAPVPEVPK
ncbi:MAG: DUF4412 domain-containing protein [Chthoniobacter sp.]|nr:DUF4412 domain-containing protein [Chthoniobacter sp.]